jgi:trehalose-phosphatase
MLSRQPQLRKKDGKKVFALLPAINWDKGQAVLWLLHTLGLEEQAVVALYIGDDVTHEDAFQALALADRASTFSWLSPPGRRRHNSFCAIPMKSNTFCSN